MSEDKSFVIIIKLNDLSITEIFLTFPLHNYHINSSAFCLHEHLQLIEHAMF